MNSFELNLLQNKLNHLIDFDGSGSTSAWDSKNKTWYLVGYERKDDGWNVISWRKIPKAWDRPGTIYSSYSSMDARVDD
jgi:hypothetical protein